MKTSSLAVAAAAAGSASAVSYAGTNIAGFDFGCTIDGTCDLAGTTPPATGNDQMNHFVSQTGLNAFRLPVSWQYLVNNQVGGPLDENNFATYDGLVQGCINSGASLCIVDIHNYARYNGQIINQGGPTDADFASLWSQIAARYASSPAVAFGIMNEPHDLDVAIWASTVQAAVTAIREAGATGNLCLLPGTDFTSAGSFVDNGSGPALLAVTNPDGSTTGLAFDVHKYYDADNSGTNTECTGSAVGEFTALGQWLQQNGRQAMLTETGGGPNSQSCITAVCESLATLNQFSDAYLGWTGWAAGAFDQSYELFETPQGAPGSYVDQPLVTQCIAGQFTG